MTKIFLYYIYTPENAAPDSHALLIRTAALHTGEPSSAFLIRRERGKKPTFKSHPDLHFSVSHSGNLWVCAFADCEVGCDVQERRDCPKYVKLAGRWFSENEASRTATERDFFDIWSRKEAYVKLLGTGIDENFKKYDTFTLRDAVIRDFSLPGSDERFSASAACPHEFEIELFDINKI